MTFAKVEERRGADVVIAVKQPERCKTRLAPLLGEVVRIELVRSMLAAVLSAARSAQTVYQRLVVSPVRDQIPADIPIHRDSGECLNEALQQAHGALRRTGCRELVVLPADLPRITAAEIDRLVRAGRKSGFAIAPDAAGAGTNALYIGSAQPFHFQFGPDSYHLHVQQAQRLGLRPQVLQLAGFAFDVDSPADLELLGDRRWLAHWCA